jgi:choline dehydrogenase
MRCTPDKHADPMGYGRAQHPRPAIVILQSHWTPQSRVPYWRGRPIREFHRPSGPRGSLLRRRSRPSCGAIRRTREIAATEPLASVLSTEIHPGTQVVSDAALEKWIRETANSTGHPACTAAMGADPDSVLDERLRVRGVNGLRVAKAR